MVMFNEINTVVGGVFRARLKVPLRIRILGVITIALRCISVSLQNFIVYTKDPKIVENHLINCNSYKFVHTIPNWDNKISRDNTISRSRDNTISRSRDNTISRSRDNTISRSRDNTISRSRDNTISRDNTNPNLERTIQNWDIIYTLGNIARLFWCRIKLYWDHKYILGPKKPYWKHTKLNWDRIKQNWDHKYILGPTEKSNCTYIKLRSLEKTKWKHT